MVVLQGNLFVFSFSYHPGIFRSFVNVTITDERLFGLSQSCLAYLKAHLTIRSSIMSIEQWGLLIVPHLLWHWSILYNGQIRYQTLWSPSHISTSPERRDCVFLKVIHVCFNEMCETCSRVFKKSDYKHLIGQAGGPLLKLLSVTTCKCIVFKLLFVIAISVIF